MPIQTGSKFESSGTTNKRQKLLAATFYLIFRPLKTDGHLQMVGDDDDDKSPEGNVGQTGGI